MSLSSSESSPARLRRPSFGWLLRIGPLRKAIIELFHILYYGSDQFPGAWQDVAWMGVPALQCPFDLWVYQEIVCAVRPDVIVECGTGRGGAALFLASLCELLGNGRVLSIDVQAYPGQPEHPRLSYLVGSSTHPATLARVRQAIGEGETALVLLDSCHHKQHVLEELRLYGDLVTPCSYLIVQDTNVNGRPVWRSYGPGPAEAVEEFLRQDGRFTVDRSWEKHLLTFNPGGYLKRTR
ncbi:MAG: class I SAM-dependent methyltransferase [Anaerolineales bacterium]|nr:class I SAM-dependent methyltransferase [Anaerolineales bacterium]